MAEKVAKQVKNIGLLGGSTLINTAISMVRTKIIALLIGPTGVGLFGIYTNLVTLFEGIIGLGIKDSAIKSISQASTSDEKETLQITVNLVQILVRYTALTGLIIMFLLCRPLSLFTFKDTNHSLPIAFLGFAVLCNCLTSGKICIIQGMRRVLDFAKISVISAINATIICIPCYYFWGIDGIVPSMMVNSLATFATTYYFAIKINIKVIPIKLWAQRKEIKAIISLGISFLLTGVIWNATQFLSKKIQIELLGLSEVGIIAAAMAVTSILTSFILKAIWADFYPQLCACSKNRKEALDLINTQTRISLLMATPGLLCLAALSPIVMTFFYSRLFLSGVDLIRILCLVSILKVSIWPICYITVANGKGFLYVLFECISAIIELGCLYFSIKKWGINGYGYGAVFCTFYLVIVNSIICYCFYHRCWTFKTCLTIVGCITPFVAVQIISLFSFSKSLSWCLYIVVFIFTCVTCLLFLARYMDMTVAGMITYLKQRLTR